MHTLKTICSFCSIALLFIASGYGQSPNQLSTKNNIATRVECKEHALQMLFASGDQCRLNISGTTMVSGSIISRSNPNSSTQSLNIRLMTRDSSLLHISRTTNEQGFTSYTGVCLSPTDKFAYRLIRENDAYYFEPVEKKFLIAD